MFPAFFFVMARFRDGTGGAAVNAFSAGPVGEKEAVSPMIRIGPRGRDNGNSGDDRSRPQGFPLLGDQPIAQTERAQARRMGGMAFRP